MTTTIHTLPDGTTEFVVKGTITPDCIISLVKQEYHKISKNVLWNLASANMSHFTAKDMSRIAYETKKMVLNKRTAFFGVTEMIFGLSRMYQTHSEMEGVPAHICVFRDRDKALEWFASPE